MESGGPIRVLLVDDHELVRTGMRELIHGEPNLSVCGEAADASTAMRLVEETRPNVAIVDLMLRTGSGLDLVRQMRASDPTIRVVVCSMHDDTIYAERVLQAGALGYVGKQEPADRILYAIREVSAGRVFVRDEIADRILRRAAGRCGETPRWSIETLSDRELEVLDLLGAGLTTRQIADRLHLSVKTIDTYREHLKVKLDLESATALVRFAVARNLDRERGVTAGGT